MSQQGDVRLFQTNDGGDISVAGGLVDMGGGLETSAYLSLFGGNEDDAAGDDTGKTWWANIGEEAPEFEYRSETQNLLQALTITSGNLLRVEAAAARDLAWMIPAGAASRVEVSASILGLNTVRLAVTVEAEGAESSFVFAENWKATG